MWTTEPLDRPRMLARLHEAVRDGVDVVVIGAGITGAGVALDAVTRGYRVLLVDRDDIDEIVESHLRDGRPVERLRID
jgi:glycerol-3-phosphate dehydrogenase